VGEENAFHLAEGGDGDAVENVIAIVKQRFHDADERGVEFVALQHLGELGGHVIDDLVFQAAREWDGVEGFDGADAEFAERLFEAEFAVAIAESLLAFEPLGGDRRMIRRGEAEFWWCVRHRPTGRIS
jgi:hypothetical protein